MRRPRVLIIDHVAKSVTLDGWEIAPADSIGIDFEIETNGGLLGEVRLTLYASNVIIRTEAGTEHPVASDEARRIVRAGLRDVLAWLGEDDQ